MPSRIERLEFPTDIVTGSITVFNDKDYTERILLDRNTWEVTHNDQFIFSPFNDNWLIILTNSIEVKPNEKGYIPYIISPNFPCGERHAEITMQTDIPNSHFTFSKSVPVFLGILGTEVISCDIKEFSIHKNAEGFSISTLIENMGNVHVRPRVEVIDEKRISKNVRIADDIPIYPNSSRRISCQKKSADFADHGPYKVILSYVKPYGDIIRKVYRFP